MATNQTILDFIAKELSKTPLDFLTHNRFVFALTILLLFVILSLFSKFIEKRIIPLFTKRTKTKIDDLIIEKTRKQFSIIIVFTGINLAVISLNLPEKTTRFFNDFFLSIILIFIMIVLVRILDILIDHWGKTWASKTESTLDDDLLPLFHKASKVVFFVIASLSILAVWGVNITGFLAGVGVAGVVLGFALKDSLANIFGGISLILDKSIKVGDKIKLESGDGGEILDIGLRSTKIKTADNEMIIVPNGSLANARIQSYTQPDPSLRVVVKFSVEYGSDIEKVKNIVWGVTQKIKEIKNEPNPEVIFLEMGEYSLHFVARVWIMDYKNAEQIKVDLTTKIYNALIKAKIGMPFPTRTLYVKKY